MDIDDVIKQLLIKKKRKVFENTHLKSRKLKPYVTSIKKMLDVDISLPMIQEYFDETEKIKFTLQTLRSFVIKEFGEDYYKDYCKRNGWLKTKKNGDKKIPVEPKILKAAVQEIEKIPVQTQPLVVPHVSEEKLEQLLNTHIDPKNIPSRPLPAD